MTAVLQFHFENAFPVMIGDLLLSRARPAAVPTTLPTIEDTKLLFPPEAELLPTGLRQKLATIGDRLVIGWSGRFSDAQDIITHLYHVDKNGTLTREYLESYLQSTGLDDPGLLGFLKLARGYLQFGYRNTEMPTSLLGNVGFLGSGSGDLEKLLRSTGIPGNFQLGSSGKPVPIPNRGILYALGSVGGPLLANEVANGTTVQCLFGGGYEIAFLDGDRFRKLDEVTYAFWTARIVNRNEIRISHAPFHVAAYGYTNDILTIRSLFVDSQKGGFAVRHAYAYVGPIYRQPADAEIAACPIPQLNNKWLCNSFFITSVESTPVFTFTLCRASHIEQGVFFQETEEGIRIAVQQSFLEMIAHKIREKGELDGWW